MLRGERVSALETQHRRADGSVFDVSLTVCPILDEAGDIVEVSLIGRNITERKQAEQVIRINESALREAQRIGRFGSFDWDAQTDTIVWSDEYYRIYGLDPGQKPPGYKAHLEAYTAESAARLDEAVNNSMQTGEPYVLDLEQVRTDGTRGWVTARGEVKRDSEGRIVGLCGTAQDITERKQAELEVARADATLRETATRLNQAQRLAQLGSWELDIPNDVLAWSDETYRIFEIDPAEFGASYEAFLDAIHPDDREAVDVAVPNPSRRGLLMPSTTVCSSPEGG